MQFPHVQTVIHLRRQASTKKKAAAWEDAYYLGSQPADSKTPPQWLQTIRDHWAGVEIRNHWRKDACLFEDKTRSRNPQIVGNLILLRNLALFFFAEHRDTYGCLPAFVETLAARPPFAFSLLRRSK